MSLKYYIWVIMSLRSLAQNFEAFISNWDSLRVQRVLQLAADVNALRKSRVINDRVDHTGQSFGTYAPDTQAQKVKAGRDRSTGGNPLFDSGFGSLDFPNYNFTDTGEMWRSVVPQLKQATANEIIVRIQARGEKETVMEILEAKYGPINQLSEAEEEFITSTIDSWLEMDLNQYNLN